MPAVHLILCLSGRLQRRAGMDPGFTGHVFLWHLLEFEGCSSHSWIMKFRVCFSFLPRLTKPVRCTLRSNWKQAPLLQIPPSFKRPGNKVSRIKSSEPHLENLTPSGQAMPSGARAVLYVHLRSEQMYCLLLGILAQAVPLRSIFYGFFFSLPAGKCT